MKPRDLPVFRDEAAKKLLRDTCAKHRITITLLRDLLSVQRDFAGSGRHHGINEEFSTRLSAFLDEQDEEA